MNMHYHNNYVCTMYMYMYMYNHVYVFNIHDVVYTLLLYKGVHGMYMYYTE